MRLEEWICSSKSKRRTNASSAAQSCTVGQSTLQCSESACEGSGVRGGRSADLLFQDSSEALLQCACLLR